jgi:hypothetical protein
LEGVQQVVPYEHVRELLGFHKGAPEKVDVPPGMLDSVGVLDRQPTKGSTRSR